MVGVDKYAEVRVSIDLTPWLNIMHGTKGNIVYFKTVPLWFEIVAANTNDVDVFLYDGTLCGTGYMLVCIDGLEQIYTYGMWDTLGEAMKWIENPVQLY